jgi:hypothetical protein
MVGVLALPLMFGWMAPNPKFGIRIAATVGNPATSHWVHVVLGWIVFSGAMASSFWLWRRPKVARLSPLTLATLAMTAIIGFMLG